VHRGEPRASSHRAGEHQDTGGYFVATLDDPDDYLEVFPAACATADIECEDVT
jgi:hypothetical protein